MQAAIDAHFASRIRQAQEIKMREHLLACARCEKYYRKHLVLAEILNAGADGEARVAVGLGLQRRRARWPVIVPPIAALSALAAVIVLAGPGRDDYQARGSGAALPSRIFIYRVGGGTAPREVTHSIGASEELAVAYQNGAAKRRLMVFGIDEHHHIYWYCPGWTDSRENPHALQIVTDGRTHELKEAITHRLDGKKLRILGVFTDEDWSVQEVEAAIRRSPGDPFLPGSVQDVWDLEIRP